MTSRLSCFISDRISCLSVRPSVCLSEQKTSENQLMTVQARVCMHMHACSQSTVAVDSARAVQKKTLLPQGKNPVAITENNFSYCHTCLGEICGNNVSQETLALQKQLFHTLSMKLQQLQYIYGSAFLTTSVFSIKYFI